MTQIFVSHSKDDFGLRRTHSPNLEAKGYTTWREPTSLTMESISYPRTIETCHFWAVPLWFSSEQ